MNPAISAWASADKRVLDRTVSLCKRRIPLADDTVLRERRRILFDKWLALPASARRAILPPG